MKLFLAFIGLVAIAISSLAEQAKEKDDIGVVIGIDLGTTYSWYVKREFLLLNLFNHESSVLY